MSGVVANNTYAYNGKGVVDLILRPSFVGKLPESLTVIQTKGSLRVKQTLLQVASGIVKWVTGWQGGVAETMKEKDFDLFRLKSERAWKKSDWAAYIQREAESIYRGFQDQIVLEETVESIPKDIYLAGIAWEDFLTNPATQLEIATATALWRAQQLGVIEGVIKNYWLANPYAITNSAITAPNAASILKYGADIRYNAGTGVWKSIKNVASASPTIDQIKLVPFDTTSHIATASIAQVDTLTLDGATSGTYVITVLGTAYSQAVVGSSLDQTADAWIAAHAATLALYGMVVTKGATAAIVFTYLKGVAFDAVAAGATTTGTRVATTAAVVAGAIKTDMSIAMFNDMIAAQGTLMKSIPAGEKVFYCTQSVLDNWENSMMSAPTTSPLMLEMRTNGIPSNMRNHRGIKLELMPIDAAISGDFGGYAPHRVLLTVKQNLCLIISEEPSNTQTALWYNQDENQTRTRTEVEIGGDYWLPELCVAAY